MSVPVLPGACLGVLGGGQLGRMLALAARPMGYRVAVLDPDPGCPAAPVADVVVATPYDDPAGLERLAEVADVVTLEFENVPSEALRRLGDRVPVRPGPHVLETTRDRRLEKAFLERAGAGVAPWLAVGSEAELTTALEALPLPAILKTATLGYDGKGQVHVSSEAEARAAWDALGERPCVLEGVVDFALELSVIVARSSADEVVAYPPFENVHRGGILDASVWPARVPPGVSAEATATALRVAEALGVVGLLAVELFVTPEGRVLANELAPRPHNSGHLTLEGAPTSQFAQAVRAVCGLPLGSVEPRPAAMANLLGELWNGGEPNWAAALAVPGVALHLYGKREARPGRKMGHLTALAPGPDEALERVLQARRALR